MQSENFIQKIGTDYCLDMTQMLGRGASGTVFKAYLSSDPSKIFAIKVISLMECNPKMLEKMIDILEREIEINAAISHPNIVEMLGGIHTPENYYFVHEFCDGGDLGSWRSSISLEDSLVVVKTIAEAMASFNSLNIIHRDIKPENILIHKGVVKIADMGFARRVENAEMESRLTGEIGTPYYMAPEVFHGEKYDGKCDVWSLGVMFFELVEKKRPWRGSSKKELFQNMVTKKIEFKNKEVDPVMRDLIQRMLKVDTKERLSFEKMLKHPLFDGKRKIPNKLSALEKSKLPKEP